MRTLFWICALALLLTPCVSAQDWAQLRQTIENNIPARLPDDLGRRAPPQELVDACKVVVEAANQVYALPGLDDQNRRWTLQREAIARIILAYVDTPAHYARLAALSDELDQFGLRNVAQLTEEHVLKIGSVLVTQTDSNAVNICPQSLAERMVLFAEQHSGPESLQLFDLLLRQVRTMRASHRDRRLDVIAPIFQEYFKKIHHTAKADALEPDIQRATLLHGKPIHLMGVDLDGRNFDPASVRNKVVLLQFWGTWCAPCRAEMPDLIALYEKYRNNGFEIIGVNTGSQGDDERRVRNFVDTTLFNGKKIPWKILHEGLGERQNRTTMTKFYGIDELPVLILIGRDGKVLHLHPLPNALDALVAEATDPLAAIRATFTEEEWKQYEENQRRQKEEIDQQIREALSAPR